MTLAHVLVQGTSAAVPCLITMRVLLTVAKVDRSLSSHRQMQALVSVWARNLLGIHGSVGSACHLSVGFIGGIIAQRWEPCRRRDQSTITEHGYL